MIRRLVGENIRVELTAPDQEIFIQADPSQIEQAMLNLAANARDAMPHGGTLAITIGTYSIREAAPQELPKGEYAAISVSDSGVGMDEATMAQIFEPFFTTKEVGKGTGLGLATVFANVTKLGGKVTVDSAPGKGSTFQILLPRSEAAEKAGQVETRPESLPRPQREGVVLVAEDDEALRRAARFTLKAAGFGVLEAKDGEEAIKIAASGAAFRILVTDVVMPGMNGVQLATDLRQRFPGLPVLYVSGWVEKGVPLELGVPGTLFLAKPYTATALVEAVGKLMNDNDALKPGKQVAQDRFHLAPEAP
jgi:two-component system cell cycle sensor histidine kinase/response regulator CckA